MRTSGTQQVDVRRSLIVALAVSTLAVTAACVDGQIEPDGQQDGAIAQRHCTGVDRREVTSSDGMTTTDQITAVFDGGEPPGATTFAVVQYNNLPGSTSNFFNPGLTVEVPHPAGWRITGLRVTVSTGEIVQGGGTYDCDTELPIT